EAPRGREAGLRAPLLPLRSLLLIPPQGASPSNNPGTVLTSTEPRAHGKHTSLRKVSRCPMPRPHRDRTTAHLLRKDIHMTRKSAALGSLCVLLAGTALAGEGPVPGGISSLDHVFIIVMENHAYGQIVGNPSAPFTNKYRRQANTARKYYAVGHPSLTNY